MQLIYCKSTEKRARQFQICTSIIQKNDEKKCVIKKAVYREGKNHIHNIAQNYALLESICPGQAVPCNETENGVVFPYINGESYEILIKNQLLNDDDIEHWKNVLKAWRKLIVGNTSNEVIFDNSTKFQNVFGNSVLLTGDIALKITNFDAIGENILSSKSGLFFIDYEWVFDFPVPLDLTMYRIIKQFYQNNKAYFDWERLLEAVSITDKEKIAEYERLLDCFNLYVSFDNQENIQYEALGKIFKQARIIFQNSSVTSKYIFPKELIESGKKVVIYGAGDVGQSFYHDIKNAKDLSLVGWVDKNYRKYKACGYDVNAIESIFNKEYDYILLAIYNESIVKEIEDELNLLGVEKNKIIWKKPQMK